MRWPDLRLSGQFGFDGEGCTVVETNLTNGMSSTEISLFPPSVVVCLRAEKGCLPALISHLATRSPFQLASRKSPSTILLPPLELSPILVTSTAAMGLAMTVSNVYGLAVEQLTVIMLLGTFQSCMGSQPLGGGPARPVVCTAPNVNLAVMRLPRRRWFYPV